MKATIQHGNVNLSVEFTPEEVGKIIPLYFRALFNVKIATTQTTTLLKNKLETLQKEVGWKKFALEKAYLSNDEVELFFDKIPFFIKSKVKDKILNEFSVTNYEASNVFFAIMDLFFNKLKKKDIKKIFERFNLNDQASTYSFLKEIKNKKPELLTPEINVFLENERLKWDAGFYG